ncbi:hypothetical protein [Corallococcus sp. AB038B]|uniref:hypothetical protein n=1 Tax=Corallococcus sp. AB038B TaxID=2316718 RepID=UPI000EDB4FEF|nr:hypothetical protein [Corallococcus sp. AB038B]RKI05257.1 hypothetical protein D7Y04_10485 [Corallococcus sp. AB038B]
MTLAIGKAVDIQVDRRYLLFNRGYAIGDVYDALAELLTNADDSYDRLFQTHHLERDGGPILIEHHERRGGLPSSLIIRDHAEGMDARDMEQKLGHLGGRQSAEGNRGVMGRGAKDCTALGDLTYESIKNGHHYKCKLGRDLKLTLLVDRARATQRLRESMGGIRRNGTSVTLVLDENVTLPRLDSLFENLPLHFALRDLLAEGSPTVVTLRERGKPSTGRRLISRPPEGRRVYQETYAVEGYAGVKASVSIFRAPAPLTDERPRFHQMGLLVKSTRAIHQNIIFEELKKEPRVAYFFGRIECPDIDRMLREYDERLRKRTVHPLNNPTTIIDPSRRYGLQLSHPFVEALFRKPREVLRELLAKELESERARSEDISSEDTRRRLDKLGEMASRFLFSRTEERTGPLTGEKGPAPGPTSELTISPLVSALRVGDEREFLLFARTSRFKPGEVVTVSCSAPEALQLDTELIHLVADQRDGARLVGVFHARGIRPAVGIVLTAMAGGLTARASVKVIGATSLDHLFGMPLEFERKTYSVRVGQQRRLKLLARCPQLVPTDTQAVIRSHDEDGVVVLGDCWLRPVTGTNYAEGRVVVEGRRPGSTVELEAKVNGQRATTQVHVSKDGMPRIEIKIVPEDYVHYRARWASNENKPWLLKIAGRHPSIARYLGSEEDGYPGQGSLHFRALLAEIVAYSVCHRSLTEDAQAQPADFEWEGTAAAIAEGVLYELNKRLSSFLEPAHSIMLSEADLRKDDPRIASPSGTRGQASGVPH